MNYPYECPHCGAVLDAGDVFQVMKAKYGIKKAKEWAPGYGWSKKNKVRFSKLIGIYDETKDRTVGYECPECRKKVSI